MEARAAQHPSIESRGNATLYALVIIPVAMSLSAAAIDIAAWYSLRDDLQQYADGLALHAANFLPDQEAARSYIESAPSPPGLAGITARGFFPPATKLSVEARLSVRYDGTLTRLIPGFDPRAFQIERKATAEVVPADFILIVADGSTLRPRMDRSISSAQPELEASWGDESAWPASGYFNCANPPRLGTNSSVWNWWSRWNDPAFRRWATQSCFNPSLSPLKFGAISLIDEIAAATENRLGMLLTPGDNPLQGFTALKRLRRETSENANSRSEILWTGYVEGERFLGDEVCMLFAEPDSAFSDRFALPPPHLPSQPLPEGAAACRSPLENPPCGRVHTPTGNIAPCFLQEALTLRQAYYWRAARLSSGGSPNYPNLPAALLEAKRELQDADLGADKSRLERARGNLAYKALRRVIMLTDFLPDVDGGSPSLRSLLSELAQARISLLVIAYNHPGLSAFEQSVLRSRAEQLAAVETGKGELRTFFASSPDELIQKIIPRLLLIDRQVVIRG